jgi:DNA-binding transcriptional regulator GbsR (MarR family)
MEQFREKIEQYGSYYEKQGFSPVASRIMIYLLLLPREDATFDDIVQYFGVSKSAVSNALKVLLATNLVSEKTKAGARKRYFRISLDHAFSAETAVKSYRETRMILEDISKLKYGKAHKANDLSPIIDFIKLLEEEYPKMYEKARKSGKMKPG